MMDVRLSKDNWPVVGRDSIDTVLIEAEDCTLKVTSTEDGITHVKVLTGKPDIIYTKVIGHEDKAIQEVKANMPHIYNDQVGVTIKMPKRSDDPHIQGNQITDANSSQIMG